MQKLKVASNEAGQRLDKLLSKYLSQAGKGFLYKMIRKKNITLNGKKCDGSERVEEGDVIQLGRLGNFRMVADSKGVENEADFNTSFFNKARIVFSPGTMLTQVKKNVTFEHLDLVPAGDKPSSGGGEEKPGEL